MTTNDSGPSDVEAVSTVARRHGLALAGEIELNEIGLDFRVAFATDEGGTPWVLRIPRRVDVWPRAENERRVLELIKGRLPVEVPDWRIATPDLVAYHRLAGKTAMTYNPEIGEPSWQIDPASPAFAESLAHALHALHKIDPDEAAAAGLKVSTPEEARRAFAADLDRVRQEIGVGEVLWRRWQSWLDDDSTWPPFSTLVHGDLYAGHVLVDDSSRATGILDWTEAEVGDPSIDFTGHLMAFGEEGLDRLLTHYEAAGGRTWPKMRQHIGERLSAFPVRYALFVLSSGLDEHRDAVRSQLGLDGSSS